MVRPFDALSGAGQIRRLRVLALGAAERYGLLAGQIHCVFVAQSFNTTFRLQAASGVRTALRVGHQRRIHAPSTELVEAAWIAALGHDSGLAMGEVVAARDGRLVVSHGDRGVPGDRLCTMFRWVDGSVLGKAMNAARAQQLGTLSALLHDHAAVTAPVDAPAVLVADTVLYWQVEDRLAGVGPLHGGLLSDAVSRVQEYVGALWDRPPERPHLLHGDLTPANVIVVQGGLVPIDFQDLVWGFDIQDLAITLAARPFTHSPQLVAAFRAGYQQLRPWPSQDRDLLAALIVGRHLHQLNLTLNLARPDLAQEQLARIALLTREWMTTSA